MSITQLPSDNGKLVGAGGTIMLGGAPVRLRFDMPALIALEEEWGSLATWHAQINGGVNSKINKALASAIRACVRDLPMDPVELMDLKLLTDYLDAVGEAFTEAMPTVKKDSEGQPVDAEVADRPLAGTDSSGSPSSAGGWRPPSSGT